MYKYNIYNVEVKSDIKLPCKHFENKDHIDHKVRVIYNNNIFAQEFESFSWIGTKHGFLRSYDMGSGVIIGVSNLLRLFIAKDGSKIHIEAEENQLSRAAAYVIGLGMSICMFFLGKIPIHAASFITNEKLIGIIAESGTGKSTLSWKFMERGANYFGDDVLPINTWNIPYANPSISIQPKITKESAEKLNIDYQKYKEIVPHVGKYLMNLNEDIISSYPQKIDYLFILKPSQLGIYNKPVIERVKNERSISLFMENTHGWWALPLNERKNKLVDYYELSKNVQLYKIYYERNFDSITSIIDEIQSFEGTCTRSGKNE